MKFTLTIICVFATGIAVGLTHVLPETLPYSEATTIILYILIAQIGFSLGSSPNLKDLLKGNKLKKPTNSYWHHSRHTAFQPDYRMHNWQTLARRMACPWQRTWLLLVIVRTDIRPKDFANRATGSTGTGHTCHIH